MLLSSHGEDILRIKGLVTTKDVGRVAINTVQHVVHAPEHIEKVGPDRTELIFITTGIHPEQIGKSYQVFQGFGKDLVPRT
jgi:G3E family GTPase